MLLNGYRIYLGDDKKKNFKLDSSNDYATLCRYLNATRLYTLKWLGLEIARKDTCHQT